MNEGKKFEQDFINSVPEDWFKYRLNDSASSWSNNGKSRFTPSNVCDFIVYNGKFWLLELKSHKGKSIPLTCIREKQVKGLLEAYKKGTNAGYIFNFRDLNETYYVTANSLNSYLANKTQESVPLKHCRDNGVLIPQAKKISRYRYDLSFMVR